jgi:hypothetical protein
MKNEEVSDRALVWHFELFYRILYTVFVKYKIVIHLKSYYYNSFFVN